MIIKDSGQRTEFETGAVRDMHEGKGDFVAMPADALLRLSKLYEAGAKKYGRFNYLKGIPISSFMDSALRHIYKYLAGWDDEDHLSAAAFNILGAMQMEEVKPEMNDLAPIYPQSPMDADIKEHLLKPNRICENCRGLMPDYYTQDGKCKVSQLIMDFNDTCDLWEGK